MSIIISTTNTPPYAPLTDNRKSDSLVIDQVNDETVETTTDLYLIVVDEAFSTLQIRVENENSSGTSLYVSPVDIVGAPTHWGKLVTLTDIDGISEDSITQFKYKWTAINNLFLLKKLEVAGNINVYEV